MERLKSSEIGTINLKYNPDTRRELHNANALSQRFLFFLYATVRYVRALSKMAATSDDTKKKKKKKCEQVAVFLRSEVKKFVFWIKKFTVEFLLYRSSVVKSQN